MFYRFFKTFFLSLSSIGSITWTMWKVNLVPNQNLFELNMKDQSKVVAKVKKFMPQKIGKYHRFSKKTPFLLLPLKQTAFPSQNYTCISNFGLYIQKKDRILPRLLIIFLFLIKRMEIRQTLGSLCQMGNHIGKRKRNWDQELFQSFGTVWSNSWKSYSRIDPPVWHV